jgi:ABC-type phosphonate transport system ATPase subunit
MSEGGISDAQIAAMTAAERRDLISRLERPLVELLPASELTRLRRIRLVMMVGATIGLVPWIVYLAMSLPDKYVAQNWPTTWVGFDILILGFMATTAVLGLLRRQLLVLTAFTTGVLLICDAWFDVMTAAREDRWLSVLTAVFGELPLAVLLITGALRVLRLTATRLYVLEPGMPLWRIPLLP